MFTVKQIIQQFNSFGYWKVLFGWRSIKRWAIESLLEIQLVVDNAERQRFRLEKLERELQQSGMHLEGAETRIRDLERDRDLLNQQTNELRNKIREAELTLTEERSKNERREEDHNKAIQSLNELKDDLSNQRKKLAMERDEEIAARIDRQRTTWQTHEETVKNRVRMICEKHTIEYIDNPPFTGRPDNTLKICNEYIVFDAKSPAGEDHSNFASYLKSQAEEAKKYAKQENVSKDIFFIIPSNTLESLSQTTLQYTFPAHRVFILPAEALEIVMLRLKKIEEYEFAEQLSPEHRDNICRIIARMIYHLKRKIQVDNHMNKEALSLAGDCGTLLPPDLSELVEEIQRSIRVNPPQDRMGKDISLTALEKEMHQVEKKLDSVML